MSPWVRRLLLLGFAVCGLWVLYRLLVDRAEPSGWRSPGPPQLGSGRPVRALPPVPAEPPVIPVRDLDAFRAGRTVAGPVEGDVDPPSPTATQPEAAPGAESSPGRAEHGNLDKVRERLASIHVDLPPVRGATTTAEVGATARSRRKRRTERWREPAEDGSCDQSHPVKVKVRSGLFHLPGMFAYERTRADRCYRSSADAEADGFERAKR